jgi:hypothetical protein
MFNLNQAVAAWRRQMAAAGITSAEALDELESHLRDDVEELVRAGADGEKAFDSAVRRIGPASALRKEFAKSVRPNVAWRRRLWRTFYYCSAAIAILADLWALLSFELSASERAAGACAVAGLAWYLLRRPFLVWLSGGVARGRLQSTIKAVGVILPIWTLWEMLTAVQLIHIEFGVIPTMIMWSLCAAYGLTVLDGIINDRYGSDGPPDFGIPVPPAWTFTQIAWKALDLAREEALRLGHDYIGTEHVLLGLLRMPGDTLAKVLERSQVHGDAVRREIERLVSSLPAQPTTNLPHLPPFTPRARKALQFAGTEAAALKHPLISPEHVLLGLLIEGSGLAALALKNVGVQLKRMRAEISAT